MRWRKKVAPDGSAPEGTPRTPDITPIGTATLPSPADGVFWFDWRGHRIGYTRRGDGAPPLLLLHDVRPGSSSADWNAVIGGLAVEHTVYTLDLLGFGRSVRPNVSYTARLQQSLISDFVSQVSREPTVLVAAGRAAAYAIALAARDPGRFPALVAVAPTGLVRATGSRRDGAERFLARPAVRYPLIGDLLYRASVSRARLRRWLLRAYADDGLVTDSLVTGYLEEARKPGARFVAAALAAGRLDLDVRSAIRRLAQPMLLVWGTRASMVPADESLGFRALKPDTDAALIDLAGDMPHVERPTEFLRATEKFLARLRRGRVEERPVAALHRATPGKGNRTA